MLRWAFSPRFWLVAASLAVSVPAAAAGAAPQVRLHTIHLEDGRAVGTLADGSAAELTVNPELQEASSRLLSLARPLAGAVVMVEVSTGKVIALDTYRRRGAPAGNPLTVGAPSASLFKLVTTGALFEHTRVSPDTRVCFIGGERQIDRRHLDRPRGAEARCAPFFSALGHSWNAVYAQLATQHLMRTDLQDTALQMGFNEEVPFDAEAIFGHVSLPYNDLEFARAAAGFQGSTLTPLGAAHLTYSIALGGRAARMKLIAQAGDYRMSEKREWLSRTMSANAAWRLTRMMEVTVHGGTSLGAFTNEDGMSYLGSIRVAGKTGTLQRGRNAPTTSWFTGFAPSRNPKVVVTVMLQNGKVWRQKANEVARDLLRFHFADRPGISSPFE